jgi:hypothetical protein
MNLKLFPLFFLLLLPLTVPAPAVAQGEKPVYKLGLLVDEKDQNNKGREEKKVDAEVLNAATDAFLAARRFKMIERNQLASVFTEKSLQDFIGGKVNNKLSDVLDLDLVGIVGYTVERSKSETTARWIIDVRLIDVKTAALLNTVTSNRASLQSMLPPATPREAGPLLAQSIREAFPPLGYVVRIDGKEIMVDLGSDAGLKEKDTLEIIQEGEKFPHPVTGELISAPLKVVGELKVVSASPQVAICKSKKGDVQMGSIVRLKGTESAIVNWLMKVPRIVDEYKKKRGIVEEVQ